MASGPSPNPNSEALASPAPPLNVSAFTERPRHFEALDKLFNLECYLLCNLEVGPHVRDILQTHFAVFENFYGDCLRLAVGERFGAMRNVDASIYPVEDFLKVLATQDQNALSKILLKFRHAARSVIRHLPFDDSNNAVVLDLALGIWSQPESIPNSEALKTVMPGRIGYALPHRFVAGLRDKLSHEVRELAAASNLSVQTLKSQLGRWGEEISSFEKASGSNQAEFSRMRFSGSYGTGDSRH